jgi:hypothetical protein
MLSEHSKIDVNPMPSQPLQYELTKKEVIH